MIVYDKGQSENSSYNIYTMKNNKMQKIELENGNDYISGFEFLTNQKGDFYVKDDLFSIITPDLVNNQYKIENGDIQTNQINVSDISDIKSSVKNSEELFFTEDLNNVDKLMEMSADVESFEEALNNSGIRYLNKDDSFKILDFTESKELYVELNNSVKGYIFGIDHISN